MEELTNWTTLFVESLKTFGNKFMGAIPSILGALIIFLIGWLIAKLISIGTIRVLRLIKFDELTDKVNTAAYLRKANISSAPSRLIGKFIYWVFLLIVLITASDTLGWETVSGEISKLISYLPKLLIAVVIFIVGTYIATFIRDIIAGATNSLGISTGKIASSFVFYLLFIIVALTALNQAGVDTSIITSNMLMILGAVLLAASISYGFASRELLSNILSGYYSKNTFPPGLKIEVDGISGIIKESSSISISLQTDDGDIVVIPYKNLTSTYVKIIKS